MPVNVNLLRQIIKGVEAGRVPAATARRAMGGSPEGVNALQVLMGLGAEQGMDIFGRRPGALTRIPGRSYNVPDLGPYQAGPRRVAGLPEARISERPTAIVPSPAGSLEYAEPLVRMSDAEYELLTRGGLPGGQRQFGVQAVDVREIPAAGRGYYKGGELAGPVEQGALVRTGNVLEDLTAYPQTVLNQRLRYPDAAGNVQVGTPQRLGTLAPTFDPQKNAAIPPYLSTPLSAAPMPERPMSREARAAGAGLMPGSVPFSEEAIQNALVGGVQTGDLGAILKAGGVGLTTGLGAAFLGKMLGLGQPSETQGAAQAPLPGTAPRVNPPGTIPVPGQQTGGVENAPQSPVPQSPAGQVVLTTPGDRDEALREQVQQYTGEKMRATKPGGREVKYPNQLAQAYADQAEFGRQNMDMIVDRLGLTGNMEVWARSNPLPAARLFLQTEAKRLQKTDANQRTTFPSPLETQPRGLSQQSPTVQARMVNTTLGSDFERNQIGSIAFNTEKEVAPSQGAFDLAQSLTPLAQPTLMNPDQYQLQQAARQAQLRDIIFQQFGAR